MPIHGCNPPSASHGLQDTDFCQYSNRVFNPVGASRFRKIPTMDGEHQDTLKRVECLSGWKFQLSTNDSMSFHLGSLLVLLVFTPCFASGSSSLEFSTETPSEDLSRLRPVNRPTTLRMLFDRRKTKGNIKNRNWKKNHKKLKKEKITKKLISRTKTVN